MQFSHSGYQNLIDIAPLDGVHLMESLCLCQPPKWVLSHQDSHSMPSTKASLHVHFQELSVCLKANRNNQLPQCPVMAGYELMLVSKSSSDCWCQPVLLLGWEDWLMPTLPMDLAQRAGRCLSPSSCAPAILIFHTVL